MAVLAIVVAVLPASVAAAGQTAGSDRTTAGSIGIRLLDAPITDDPRASLYIVDHLGPGTLIHRRIEISNSSATPTRIRLYAAAAKIVKGSFIGAAGRAQNELSTWTTVRPRRSIVTGGGRSQATVTIAVPPDAAPGERYGVIWAEARSGNKKRDEIIHVNRVGIRIYLSVGGNGEPAADLTIDSLTAARSDDGRPLVHASVHNTGGRAIDVNGTLRLRGGPSGLSAGPFPVSLGTTLAIGGTESVTILLDRGIPAGPWDAQITLGSGSLRRSAHAVITFPDSGSATSVPTPPTGPGWAQLLLIAMLGLAVAISILAIRQIHLREPVLPARSR